MTRTFYSTDLLSNQWSYSTFSFDSQLPLSLQAVLSVLHHRGTCHLGQSFCPQCDLTPAASPTFDFELHFPPLKKNPLFNRPSVKAPRHSTFRFDSQLSLFFANYFIEFLTTRTIREHKFVSKTFCSDSSHLSYYCWIIMGN